MFLFPITLKPITMNPLLMFKIIRNNYHFSLIKRLCGRTPFCVPLKFVYLDPILSRPKVKLWVSYVLKLLIHFSKDMLTNFLQRFHCNLILPKHVEAGEPPPPVAHSNMYRYITWVSVYRLKTLLVWSTAHLCMSRGLHINLHGLGGQYPCIGS